MTLCLAGVVLPSSAYASPVLCGQRIQASTVLDRDVGPCHDVFALVVESGVVLDLGGHSIFGDGSIGILLSGERSAHVTNGTVRGFGTGVLISEGGGHTVTRLRVVGTSGTAGISVRGASSSNRIAQNQITGNAGIGIALAGTVTGPVQPGSNTVEANTVEGNGRAGVLVGGGDNLVTGNRVANNGGDGLVTSSFRNSVRRNTVTGNGFAATGRDGDGIRVELPPLVPLGTPGDVVETNAVFNNAGNGIHVGARHPDDDFTAPRPTRVVQNSTGGNGNFDLLDSSPGNACDANVWSANTYRTAFPACTRAR